MCQCAICWEDNLFFQSLVLIQSLYNFISLISKHVLFLGVHYSRGQSHHFLYISAQTKIAYVLKSVEQDL